MKQENKIAWEWEIKSRSSWLGSSVKELLNYRDLLLGLVRKEFLSAYQQTLIGPFWIVLQPLLAVLVYVLVFVKIIGLKTIGIPSFLFFLSGVTLWNFFADMFTATSNVITVNIGIFSKVYFPRLIAPLATVVMNLFRLVINLSFLFIVLFFYSTRGDVDVSAGKLVIMIIPIIIMTGTALGFGLIFSIITVKYRDLNGFIQILLRLFMFVCPVFYAQNIVPVKYKWLVEINPLTVPFELFRYSLYGVGQFNAGSILYSVAFMVVSLAAGILLFNKMSERMVELA